MKHDPYEPRDPNIYRTGSTTPPKAYSRLVAILLILVVLLAGLVSILSVLNIRLFSAFYELRQPEDIPLSLQTGEDPEQDLYPTEADAASVAGSKSIGIVADPVKPVYQKHFGLPEGLFISHVMEGYSAHRQGIEEGDVLISLDQVSMTDEDSLQTFLDARQTGESCAALIYRCDTEELLHFTLEIQQIKP